MTLPQKNATRAAAKDVKKKEKEKDDDRLLQGLEQLLKLKRVCKKRSDGL
jgi:hypothetical protein